MSEFFVSTALAQDAPMPGPELEMTPTQELLSNPLFMVLLMFLVFYFLLIRPQQKRIKAHSQMVESLRRGDKVVTAGGIVGTVSKVEDDQLLLEIAPETKVKVVKSTITEVLTKTTPADSGDKDKKTSNDS